MTDIALHMYTDEPCRICGQNIETSDIKELVFAGYSQQFPPARAAHGRCWKGMLDVVNDPSDYNNVM